MLKDVEVILKVDEKRDFQNYLNFCDFDFEDRGRWYMEAFLPKELRHVLDTDKAKADAEVKEHVQNTYTEKRDMFAQKLADIQQVWKEIEPAYFELVNQIFKGHPFPTGIYTGWGSIFCMYPRHIEEKEFFFPLLNPDPARPLKTIAHELLHYIFFDYIKTTYGIINEQVVLPGKDPRHVWNVSETLNVVIENWQPYQKLLHTDSRPYDPVHEKLLPGMTELWNERQDIEYLLDQYLK